MMQPIIEIIEADRQAAIEGEVLRAVQRIGVNVDKDRLIQALTEARKFYDEGYRAALANGVGRWVGVDDEEKPRHGQECFIRYTFGNSDLKFYGSARYYASGANGYVDRPHFSNEGWDGMRVTHWMEIPKLPKEDDNGN